MLYLSSTWISTSKCLLLPFVLCPGPKQSHGGLEKREQEDGETNGRVRVDVGNVGGRVLEHSLLDGDDDEGGEGAEDAEYRVRLVDEEPDIPTHDFPSSKGVFHVSEKRGRLCDK